MSESKLSEFKTSFNNNANFIPTFASQEPLLKFGEPNISQNSQKKDYLKSMYQFVAVNEKENFGIECPKESQLPNLPNHIVPVLYVPHRILTNEELLQVTQFHQVTPKENKQSKGILTTSENEIYQRLTNKLGGIKISESNRDDGTTDYKSCFKNPYEYSNPRYTITSNSENCLHVSSSENIVSSVPANNSGGTTDNTQNIFNIKSSIIKNKNTATPKKVHPDEKRPIKRVHSRILNCVQKKKLHTDADFIPHLESKITQTQHKVKQISTQTKRKEEETYNGNALLDAESESKNFSSCTNVPELLEDYLIFNDGIEIITPEDFIVASYIPLVSSPLDEIMSPKLKTHSNIN